MTGSLSELRTRDERRSALGALRGKMVGARRFERRCRRPVPKHAKIVCFRKLFLCSTRWYYSFLVWQTGIVTPA